MKNEFTQAQVIAAYEGTMNVGMQRRGMEYAGPCPGCSSGVTNDSGKPSNRFFIRRDGSIGCRSCEPSRMNGAAYKAIMTRLGLGGNGEPGEPATYPATYRDPKFAPVDEVIAEGFQAPEEFHQMPEDVSTGGYGKDDPSIEYGCTVARWAQYLCLPEEWLRHGKGGPRLRDGEVWVSARKAKFPSVWISCRPGNDEWPGHHRILVSGPDKYRARRGLTAKWTEEVITPQLYGIWWLEAERVIDSKAIAVVEGQSDPWPLWWRGIPAVGIPGTGTVDDVLTPDLLTNVDLLYVFQEPDAAGAKFPAKVHARCEEIGWCGTVIPTKLPPAFKDIVELHQAEPEMEGRFKSIFGRACQDARKSAGLLVGSRLAELAHRRVEPVPWLIYPILRKDSLAMLWAGSQVGKSTLALQIAVAVATGTTALGMFDTTKAGVVYVGFEQGTDDDRARNYQRLGVSRMDLESADFFDVPSLERAKEGGMERLCRYLDQNPETGLVVIDTLQRFWSVDERKGVYAKEYDGVAAMEELHRRYGVCTLLTHHSTADKRKFSGSEGMKAAPTTFIELSIDDVEGRMEPGSIIDGELQVVHNSSEMWTVPLQKGRGGVWACHDSRIRELLDNRHNTDARCA